VSSQAISPSSPLIAMTDLRRRSLERLFARIGEVATLPAAAERVLRITADENGDVEKLRQAIQGDPVLVARLLRRLNSSYYALSNKVCDLKTAINLLGFREIRNLALMGCVSRLYEGGTAHGAYRRENLWTHSVAVAVAARLIARVCGHAGCEEAYIAGLLHDLGLILLDQTLRRHFFRVLDGLDEQTPTHLVESRVLSFDHALLGGVVGQQWNFPDSVVDAITFHHEPANYRGPHRELVNIVAVANYFCSRAGVTSLGIHNVQPPPEDVYQALALDQVTLAIIWEQLDTALETANELAFS